MPKGIYECVNCGHREVIDSNEALLEKACPKCGSDMVIVGFEIEPVVEEGPARDLIEKLSQFYSLGETQSRGNVTAFEVLEIKESNFEKVLRELEKLGYWGALKKKEGKVILYLFPAQEVKEENPFIGIGLFIATVLSTLFAGYWLSGSYISFLDEYNLPGIRNIYLNALAFSISVLAILGTHEMGHKIAATFHGVKSTFPYFIPFPNILGTLGAVIRVKSPIPTRNAAIDLGSSGPIAGFIVAIPVLLIGLRLSPALPMSAVAQVEGGIAFGQSLIMVLLERYIFRIPENYVIYLHPVAIAGWVGILVTFLNLIPAAQLDGGHIARAFLGEKFHSILTFGLGLAMIGLSVLWAGWLIWGFIILLMGRIGNPGALDEVSPITPRRIALALIVLAIFILSATPVPISVVQGG
ncbi:site-2 protease family protein [Thermococcus argininiproducens]|uniref:Site-2 protease family protein n=1 Tax=Thermococcus argininiproducens TaxID=2866384 RepID=A0A9E7MBG2_9EURY|nr:site-2 protease family protein [Thermococcus argininiproducens]USH00350.1 site-2 protease family protein [Thermococcus argininiproducens]